MEHLTQLLLFERSNGSNFIRIGGVALLLNLLSLQFSSSTIAQPDSLHKMSLSALTEEEKKKRVKLSIAKRIIGNVLTRNREPEVINQNELLNGSSDYIAGTAIVTEPKNGMPNFASAILGDRKLVDIHTFNFYDSLTNGELQIVPPGISAVYKIGTLETNEAGLFRQDFIADSTNLVEFNLAFVAESPNHPEEGSNPFMILVIRDEEGNPICGGELYHNTNEIDQENYGINDRLNLIFSKNYSKAVIDTRAYHGQKLSLSIIVGGCSRAVHGGLGYIFRRIVKPTISKEFCGSGYIFSAFPNFSYRWSNGENREKIFIDINELKNIGTLKVSMFDDNGCQFTLESKIDKRELEKLKSLEVIEDDTLYLCGGRRVLHLISNSSESFKNIYWKRLGSINEYNGYTYSALQGVHIIKGETYSGCTVLDTVVIKSLTNSEALKIQIEGDFCKSENLKFSSTIKSNIKQNVWKLFHNNTYIKQTNENSLLLENIEEGKYTLILTQTVGDCYSLSDSLTFEILPDIVGIKFRSNYKKSLKKGQILIVEPQFDYPSRYSDSLKYTWFVRPPTLSKRLYSNYRILSLEAKMTGVYKIDLVIDFETCSYSQSLEVRSIQRVKKKANKKPRIYKPNFCIEL